MVFDILTKEDLQQFKKELLEEIRQALKRENSNIQKEGQALYGINRSFENALLEMLATSGLTLYRSVHPFQVWIKIERDQKGTESFSCW